MRRACSTASRPSSGAAFGRGAFEIAMNALLRDRAIKNVGYGRKGDERTRIAIREVAEPQNADNAV